MQGIEELDSATIALRQLVERVGGACEGSTVGSVAAACIYIMRDCATQSEPEFVVELADNLRRLADEVESAVKLN